MIKGLIIFGAGLYAGVYVAQNYQIEKVENPKVLLEKAQAYLTEKLEAVDPSKKSDDGKK